VIEVQIVLEGQQLADSNQVGFLDGIMLVARYIGVAGNRNLDSFEEGDPKVG